MQAGVTAILVKQYQLDGMVSLSTAVGCSKIKSGF